MPHQGALTPDCPWRHHRGHMAACATHADHLVHIACIQLQPGAHEQDLHLPSYGHGA